MVSPLATAVARLRRPEYIGENRCLPCTVVNLAIGGGLAGVIALLAVPLGVTTAGLLGTGAFGVFVAVIYLRGYLVPGTPWLTRKYLPDAVLRAFDKSPLRGPAPNGGLEIEVLLRELDAVTDCEDVDDLCLEEPFRDAWREQIVALRADDTTRESLARVLGVNPGGIEFEEYGAAFVAEVDGERAGQWESRAAFVADVAAANAMRERDGAWAELDLEGRSAVLHALRLFLDRCPSCDGPVVVESEVVESCCRSIDVVAARCDACGARLFEVEHASA